MTARLGSATLCSQQSTIPALHFKPQFSAVPSLATEQLNTFSFSDLRFCIKAICEIHFTQLKKKNKTSCLCISVTALKKKHSFQCVCKQSDMSPDVRQCLLDDMYRGAERSVVVEPVEESSHPLRERSLQLRNVTLGTKEDKRGNKTTTLLLVECFR